MGPVPSRAGVAFRQTVCSGRRFPRTVASQWHLSPSQAVRFESREKSSSASSRSPAERSQTGSAAIASAKSSTIPLGTPYSKELRLLQHVLETATPGDPISVCEAIEHFGEEVLNPAGQWLKVAGRHKATVLEHAMREVPQGGSILEIGCYCGYSAIRMSLAVPGCRIVTLEVDPAHVVIARNMIAFAGLAHMVDVWTGHSKDLLPRLPQRYGGPEKFKICGVFMDQRGSRYDEDLGVIEQMGLLLPNAVVVADNVLKPGAPLFLWRLIHGHSYRNQVVRVREFAMTAEDWMSVSMLTQAGAEAFSESATVKSSEGAALSSSSSEILHVPTAPEELVQLQWESDRIRQQATRPGQSVTFAEWAVYADKMKERMAKYKIVETVDAAKIEEGIAELWPSTTAE